jgi:flavin-dependent dehydrogenase
VLAREGGNARALLDRWLVESRFARELLGPSPALEGVKGGVIPTGRARTRERLFLVGDAAGVADPFTAEGIYQAIRSGRLAAEALLEESDIAAAARRYGRACAEFDRNERAARMLQATFNGSIELFARRAAAKPAFADHLNTAVFFPKASFLSFVGGLLRAL